MTIKALRLLPPLAFARFGSAAEPQHNFELVADHSSLGFRQIRPADTLIVKRDGTLTIQEDSKLPIRPAEHSPEQLAVTNKMFREGDLIRPVAPFFEVFAIVAEKTAKQRRTRRASKKAAGKSARRKEKLVPLTLALLKRRKLEWQVHVENHKVFRRTGDPNDKVAVTTPWFSGHRRVQLRGRCKNCSKPINFGYVQFVMPSTGEVSSQMRLRFMPAEAEIYGPIQRHDPYSPGGFVPLKGRSIYKKKDGWPAFDNDKPDKKKRAGAEEKWPRETLPPSLYANTNRPPAAPWLNNNRAKSRGYLDNVCDGFIKVRIKGRTHLEAKARICVAPPAFVPDSHFVRTLADDLDQVVNGPEADDIDLKEARSRALDIVRRAYETVRFMNVAVMNGDPVKGRPPQAFDTMPAEEAFATQRPVRPVMASANADTTAVLGLHQQAFAALSSGAAPWFVSLLRKPEEVGDLTDKGRRKMPALMSGADSFYLALTHRQIETIEKAAESGPWVAPASIPSPPPPSPRNLTAQLQYRAKGNAVTSRPEMAIANCCPGLEVDFRAVWRRLFKGIELSEYDNYVVKAAGDLRAIGGKPVNLVGRRLLRIGIKVDDRKIEALRRAGVDVDDDDVVDADVYRKKVIVTLKGPTPADPDGNVVVQWEKNPGVWTMEWSNCLADIVEAMREHRKRGKKSEFVAECDFTVGPAKDPQAFDPDSFERVKLVVQDFFDWDAHGETAVISEKLAEPGELTQGLCSPWQNDLRECSCFYWAASRPDFVNTKVGNDGLTHGDYWFARQRTGHYVPDDYADNRLMSYDDLFKEWEKLLQFQIGGKDSTPKLLPLPDNTES